MMKQTKIISMFVGITLLGVNAYAEDGDTVKTFPVIPEPAKNCGAMVEFEKLGIDPKTGSVSIASSDKDKWILLGAYKETAAWLSGYLAALGKGEAASGSRPPEWLTGIFSYCKANPNATVEQVAAHLATGAERQSKIEARRGVSFRRR